MFQIVLVKKHQTRIPVESEEGESLVSRSLAAQIHEGNETLDVSLAARQISLPCCFMRRPISRRGVVGSRWRLAGHLVSPVSPYPKWIDREISELPDILRTW